MTPPRVSLETGKPEPLGATWDGHGVNFAVFSRHAENVELCLFESATGPESARLSLPARSGDIWHGYLPDAAPGQLYGYRVHGPYAPMHGHRFNPNKLLIDPYARALAGRFEWHDAVHGYRVDDPGGTVSFDSRDSAAHVPRCRVVAALPVSGRPARPRIPWPDTVLYELHVRGFSTLHPDIDPALRGTVAALAEPALIEHFKRLGVTTIELLPTAAFLDELHLVRLGLRNYWGYNPIAWMAMHGDYLPGGDIAVFAAVVDRLHEAGLEVVLDVVFNHTAEGDARGPTLAYRGLDNAVYYRLEPSHPERYRDYTGCGNTLDLAQPEVLDLVLASLRYWACEVGVDGFRFDLAPALARDAEGHFDAHAPLLAAIAADPDLNTLKWIAEPWDLGMPGHFLGAFPAPCAEWNDRYRDGVRRFWRGDRMAVGEFATRLAGSSDIFSGNGRPPSAGVNFITAHDGFTLADLTAYAHKHNLLNGENNRDGASDNLSRNGGVEGDTDDPAVLDWRRCRRRSMLGTLLLSRGTPMLRAGDELSQSQHGNNNAYCQDNALSWLDWNARGDPWRDLRAFVAQATGLRRSLKLLREDRYFDGRPRTDSDGLKDLAWLDPTETRQWQPGDWHDDARHSLAALLSGPVATGPQAREHLYLAMNAGDTPLNFRLPAVPGVADWLCVLDSAAAPYPRARSVHAPDTCVTVAAGGLLALVPSHLDPYGVPADLAARAQAAGVSDSYTEIDGSRFQVPAQGLREVLAALGEPASRSSTDNMHGTTRDPGAQGCWLPPGLAEPPGRWVLSTQVYSLRSGDSWGIGDFEDLAQMLEIAAAAGADGVLCSPVHALSLSQPQRASPYAPSSRLMLNPLLISLQQAAGAAPPEAYRRFVEHPDTRARRAQLDAAGLIDYAGVATLKLQALQRLHQAFRERHLHATASSEGQAFLRFRRDQGQALRDYAVFEALSAWFVRRDGRHRPWTRWPEALRDPRSAATNAFERTHAQDIEFFAYLQWLARQQWDRAANRARTAGMQLGLIVDLALGADIDSAEAWQGQDLLALHAELGAPADAFSPLGQRWGAPPWRPWRLAELDYAPFEALLDAAMRGAGAIRIDHVLGLVRQFWIPRGKGPAQGAYVRFPLEPLLQRIERASLRHRCAVIGEDLGNVPDGLRARMAACRMLGYRVAYFEREPDGRYRPPAAYPPLTAASIATHDLPTVAGFRKGTDIDERIARGLYASETQAAAARAERAQALAALEDALVPFGTTGTDTDFSRALHRYLAESASRLAIVQIEDILGVVRQANLPGLGDEAPNWRQRMPVALEALAGDTRMQAMATLFAARARRTPG